jgi:DNA segregation ATPase FtsK/SpoIIIE, S-DNA-T family
VSSELAANKTLGLVDTLKATVEDIGGRVKKLNEDLQVTLVRENRRYEAALEEHDKRLAAEIMKAEASFQEAKVAAQASFERRKARIGRAYQASREQSLQRVDERLGSRKYELQKAMLQAEKDREAALASTTTAAREFQANLVTEQETLANLERGAQQTFKGYGSFRRRFLAAYEDPEVDVSGDPNQLLARLREEIAKGKTELEKFHRFLALRVFGYFPLWVLLAACEFGLVPLTARLGLQPISYGQAFLAFAGTVIVMLVLRLISQGRASSTADSISKALAAGRRLHDVCQERAQTHYQQALERIKNEFGSVTQSADQLLKQAQSEASNRRVSCRMESDERTVRLNSRHEQNFRSRKDRLAKEYEAGIKELKAAAVARRQELERNWVQKQQSVKGEHAARLRQLQDQWNNKLGPVYADIKSAQTLAEQLFPEWSAPALASWTPPAKFAHAAKFGRLDVDVAKMWDAPPRQAGLVLPGPAQFSLPLCLAYPDQGSILLETVNSGHEQAIEVLNNIILRLLSTSPPGRLNFTIIDPVGLGQNFAGVMHLADFEEQMINSRIWTQSGQIEQKLADLNEHMEKVIQMYLRNEYNTIAEYNEQAGVIAEKYYFLVLADFPANFTETAAKRLLSIAASGARCGVYTLIHWDRRLPLPQDFIPEELRKSSVAVTFQGANLVIDAKQRPEVGLVLETPPSPEVATELVQRIGRFSRDSSRVEVPFEQVAPQESEIWSEETSSELTVPIGRTGATKLQYLAIGKGTRQHGLIAGKTGSGKSTLFHVMITNLALWCSPEQVEFYLVDFKKGVEFKCYAAKRLPHARVVAIESDREFGLSVLQRVDDELRRRGELFRQLGVQDVAGYKRAGGTEAIPRTLLLIDEFQEFFVEDDKIGQTASLLLDRLVRQGRAFGIHVLLGSQTLGGAYTVARTTLGQMVIRIALQCNEADAYLIMDESNPAPRLLSRPGEGIYNDMAGALEGNSPFQVVWLPEEVRDSYLTKVRARADAQDRSYSGPIVFEGNIPANIQENSLLRGLLEADSMKRAAVGRVWLGAPNSIKGPTEAAFRSQSGNNLLMVGQHEEAILALFSVALVGLAAQYPPGSAQFILCDATPPGTPASDYLGKIVQAVPQGITLARPGDLPEILKGLASEAAKRAEQPDPDAAAPVFLLIHGLQKFSRLRYEEEFGFSAGSAETEASPGSVLNNLVCERTRLGFHVIASCDTYNNVNRFLSRKALSEFEMRVVFQMSANDSASLIDTPKAGMLGLHRALFFNAQEGYLETFRPYALPDAQWVEEAARNLRRLLHSEAADETGSVHSKDSKVLS